MSDKRIEAGRRTGRAATNTAVASAKQPRAAGKRASKSMHDGIAVWCDCCSCEAEPYWAELADELGVDLGSDYEATDD